MPGATANYAWPYGVGTDSPNGAAQVQAAMVAADATVKTIDNAVVALGAKLGEAFTPITVTANSSSANSATKVLTNLTAANFPTAIGGIYEIEADFNYQSDSGANTCAFGLMWQTGVGPLVPGTATMMKPKQDRSAPAGTGIDAMYIKGRFTATTTASTVGLVLWMPTGDPGPVRVYAKNTGSDLAWGTMYGRRVG
jgi:hypothetical protein